jgi:hypothetical protein
MMRKRLITSRLVTLGDPGGVSCRRDTYYSAAFFSK